MSDLAVTTVMQSKTLGTNIAAGQGTAIDATKTMVVTPAGPLEELAILISNTAGAPKAVTFVSSLVPPADAGGIGNLTITLDATTGAQLAPVLSSARFMEHNGTLRITVDAGMTGYILPIQMPRI